MACVYLKQAIRTMETNVGNTPLFDFAATSCQGWRNTQEDVHLIIPDFEQGTSLFAVFDGHNGVEVATYVAKYLPDYIRFNRKYRSGQIVEGLKEAFVLLDNSMLIRESIQELREIRQEMHPELPEYAPGITSGCTAVVCLLKNNVFYCANIGDTRCVLCRNGKAYPLSNDTKPEDPAETARIEKAGGTVVRGRINTLINVSRAFGDHMFKNKQSLRVHEQMIIAVPDVIVERFNESTDQFMVLMCDGIWNSMANEEVISFIHKRIKTKKLSSITEEIADKILPKVMPTSGIKGKDNMTIVIIRFNGAQANSLRTVQTNRGRN
ncbi:hypothetical protein RDWZM_003658 [Blomia tropicalis]|uniref:protein-serine/threonine phosphatase n=1 Tax=Blomia tropicalis TaxID=40697 RepID=A0A9Q0RR32_BLOTA|nr:hypothetical protein BLOT_002758 [Blomia tropicalis]KAJ6225113.1 hypothetical protein RDWZM_003658 [Blomia tropicalis]